VQSFGLPSSAGRAPEPKELIRLEQTTILLVHGHELFREGIRYHVQSAPDLRIVGEADHGQQAIQQVEQLQPDLVLMETDLAGVSGLEVAWVIKRDHPQVGIVLLSADMGTANIIKAIRAGVSAYLPRNVEWSVMLQVLRAVQQGAYPINDLVLTNPAVAEQVLNEFRQSELDRETYVLYAPLSRRELQVLELIARGSTNKEIAQELAISNQTVKNHVSSILRKLAVNGRMQAVIYAIQRGWIRDISGASLSPNSSEG
jgi:DNA-binding NarL/FixJ family response regulator